VKQLLVRLVVLCGMCFLFLAMTGPRSRACVLNCAHYLINNACNTACINALNYCVQNPNGRVANAYFDENCNQQLFHSANACDADYCATCTTWVNTCLGA
jgi:hypothetical protein